MSRSQVESGESAAVVAGPPDAGAVGAAAPRGGKRKREKRGKGARTLGSGKFQCKECGRGGSQICKHGRRRLECKECGGGGICGHNKIRT
jgi:hypothetical protein